jgi:hypothetical protein
LTLLPNTNFFWADEIPLIFCIEEQAFLLKRNTSVTERGTVTVITENYPSGSVVNKAFGRNCRIGCIIPVKKKICSA